MDRREDLLAILSPVYGDWTHGASLTVLDVDGEPMMGLESVKLSQRCMPGEDLQELWAEAKVKGKWMRMPVRVEPGENEWGVPDEL